MKLITKLALTTMLASTSAFADRGGPIIVKTSGGGYTPPPWQNFEKCEVFSNKVVVTRSFAIGEIVATEEHAVSLTGTSNLSAVVEKAKKKHLKPVTTAFVMRLRLQLVRQKLILTTLVHRLYFLKAAAAAHRDKNAKDRIRISFAVWWISTALRLLISVETTNQQIALQNSRLIAPISASRNHTNKLSFLPYIWINFCRVALYKSRSLPVANEDFCNTDPAEICQICDARMNVY